MLHLILGKSAESITWWQMAARAVLIGVYALAMYRLLPSRALGNATVLDIIFTIINASSLSRALTANAPFLPTLAAVTVLMILQYALMRVSSRSRTVSRLLKGRPIRLIRDGIIDEEALGGTDLSGDDLRECLRLNGVTNADAVQAAYLERNGQVSVISR